MGSQLLLLLLLLLTMRAALCSFLSAFASPTVNQPAVNPSSRPASPWALCTSTAARAA
jgi:hypothetical protein